jgi:hypothetical protein
MMDDLCFVACSPEEILLHPDDFGGELNPGDVVSIHDPTNGLQPKLLLQVRDHVKLKGATRSLCP